jgi:hypothetical protein
MLRTSLFLASTAVLALAMVMSDQASESAEVDYPLLVVMRPIPAGMTGKRVLRGDPLERVAEHTWTRRGYVSWHIGEHRTFDASYAFGHPEYQWLSRGVAVVDIEPGQVLEREHFAPLRG